MDSDGWLEAVTMVAGCSAMLGEGPVWVERESALYWVDIKAPLIWRWCWADGDLRHWTPPLRITALAPRSGGGFVAATEAGFAFIDMDNAIYDLLGNPEPDLPNNRFNDGKIDRSGDFWAGTMDDAEQEESGSLYRLTPDRAWERIDEGYAITNGPAFSPDGRWVYHSDSARRTIYRLALGADGAVGPREPFLTLSAEEGYPDGMTVDSEGCLWVACWDGWSVRRFAPDGRRLGEIALPVQRPTSCAFGGPDIDRLFITSARIGLSETQLADQPWAGALMSVRPGLPGLAEREFAG